MATMDAMVTGRMPVGKKESGNGVLRALGLTTSQAINDLYDYLIAHGEMPCGDKAQADRAKRLEEALAYIDSFPSVKIDDRYAAMTSREIRMERLVARYGGVDNGVQGSLA